jgi:PAS domain S-box-containing protein
MQKNKLFLSIEKDKPILYIIFVFIIAIILWFFLSEYVTDLLFDEDTSQNSSRYFTFLVYVSIILLALTTSAITLFKKQYSLKSKIREKDDKYNRLVENLRNTYFIYNYTKDKEFTFLSSSVSNILGYSINDFKEYYNKNFSETKFLDVQKRYNEFEADGLKQPVQEVVFKHIDGDSRIFEINEVPIFNNDKIIAVEGVAHDITEYKENYADTKMKDDKFRTFFETANDAIFIMKGEKFIDCNKKTLELFGCTLEQILLKSPYDFSPTFQSDSISSREKAKLKIKEALKGTTQFFEWTHSHYDGTTFDAEVSLNSFRYNNEDYVQAIVRDVTKINNIEKSIKDNASNFIEIFEKTKDGIILLDENNNVTKWNKGIEEITGISSIEAIGKKIWDIQFNLLTSDKNNKKYRNRIINLYEKFGKTGELTNLNILRESKIINTHGKEVIIQQLPFCIETNKGFIFSTIIRDVSEQKDFVTAGRAVK